MLGLFWVMLVGAILIWLFVMGVSIYATRANSTTLSDKAGNRFILWGGVAFPVVVLTALLVFGLRMMPEFRAPADGHGNRLGAAGDRSESG